MTTIKLKHKVKNVFPYGDVLIPVIPKKMKKDALTNEEIEFLSESNKIEREYGEEALEDAIKAWKFAKKAKNKYSIKTLLKIQKIMSNRLAPHYSGFIREVPVFIGGECRSQSKEEIIQQLNNLFNEYKQNNLLKIDIKSKEEYIQDWHVRYEEVHPFCDFNGRTGRILMNLQRLDLGLPLLIIYDKEKEKYYNWFR